MSDPQDLRKSEIKSCDCIPTLFDWHDRLYEIADDVRCQIEAWTLVGTADPEWVDRAARKYGGLRMLMRCVETRVAKLGYTPPITRGAAKDRHIAELEAEVEALRMGRAA